MTTRLRKNQHTLTAQEWETFVGAIRTLHDAHTPYPRWQHFVDLHAQAMDTAEGMTWGVHTMDMGGTVMPGINFLPWHREFLWRLENRLRDIAPSVTLPYWDWTVDRAIPAALAHAADLTAWGITRNPHLDVSQLPTAADVNTTLAAGLSPPKFRAF
jgi:tyrosinase